MKQIFAICSVLCALLLCACGAGTRLDSARRDYAAGNYEKLAANEKSNNLELLIGADAAFQSGDYKKSDELFEVFNKRNINPVSTSITAEVGKIIAGQTAGEYKPYMMDYLFVSYYQLWDAMLSGRMADARVIINQSYSRQQKMSREYENLLKNRKNIPDGLAVDTSRWATYSDIMNPALTYMAGLYFLNIGESENARQYLARAAGMVPDNNYVADDLKIAGRGVVPNNTAWIFIETGYAPRLHEKKLNIPWLVGNNIQIISIATSYPEFYTGADAIPAGSKILANIDAMFVTEYREYQINDGARAFAKAVANAAVQSATQKNGWGGLLGMIYSVATTNAEVRTWATLPQRIYLLRITKDKSGLIKLNSGATLDVEYSGNHIIYIRNANVKIMKIK